MSVRGFGDLLPSFVDPDRERWDFDFGLGDITGVPGWAEELDAASVRSGLGFAASVQVLPGTQGLAELNARLAAIDQAELGVATDPEDVLLTSGACDGLVASVLAASEPDDGVLYAVPSFPYWWVFAHSGRRPVPLLFDSPQDYRASFGERVRAAVEEDPRARIVVLNEPQNPMGVTIDPAQLAVLDELQKGGRIEVVADDVGRVFGPVDDPSQDAWWSVLDPDACWIVESYTKRYAAPGLRLGWVRAKGERLARVRNLTANWRVGVSRPLAALGLRVADRLGRGETVRAEIRRRRQTLRAVLEGAGDPLAIDPGRYGVYALIDCRSLGGELPGPRLQEAAAEARIKLLGGDFLFPPDLEPAARGWTLRLSIAGERRVEEGLTRLLGVARRLH